MSQDQDVDYFFFRGALKLGVDKDNRLWVNGKRVVTEYSLARFEQLIALTGTISFLVMAVESVLNILVTFKVIDQ